MMRRLVPFLLSIVLASGNGGASQGFAQVTGRVLDADTGRPVPGVAVQLGSTSTDFLVTVVTDDGGRFQLSQLPAGRFRLTAKRAGYFDGAFGQRRREGPASFLVLTDQQRIDDLALQLWATATIGGSVRDEDGAPLGGADVWLLQRSRDTWNRPWEPARPADRAEVSPAGRYAFPRLHPGEYVVFVASPESHELADHLAYRSTAYLQAATLGAAPSVNLAPGERRANVDVRLDTVSAVSVAGVVVADGTPVTSAIVKLFKSGEGEQREALAVAMTETGRAGAFRFPKVPHGFYSLQVLSRAIPAEPGGTTARERDVWGAQPLVVDENTGRIELTARETSTLAGKVVVEGALLSDPAMVSGLTVTLVPVATDAVLDPLHARPTARVDNTGRFVVSGIVPGRYLIAAGGERSILWLSAATTGGENYAEVPIEIGRRPQTAGLVLTMALSSSGLRGVARHSDGTPDGDARVLLFASDTRFWPTPARGPASRRMQITSTSTNGGFAFFGVPAGEYFLAAVAEERFAGLDRPTLEALIPLAVRVTIGTGMRQQQDVRVSGR